MTLARRGFLQAILALGVAPAFVNSKVLMPVRALIVPDVGMTLYTDVLTLAQLYAARNYCIKHQMRDWNERMILV